MKNQIKIVLDTEFTSLTQDAQLLSLALVAETGEKFYAEFNDYNPNSINKWVQENVIEHFEMNDVKGCVRVEDNTIKYKTDKERIVFYLTKWLQQFDEIQMWADVPHYDWVLFCELFGGSMNMPSNVHYMCLDLATLLLANGIDYRIERISLLDENEIPENYNAHNALSDAELTLVLLKKYSHDTKTT
ncbi:MAG TPA: hypothetical protein GXZ87_08520 [Bacteroidales bacterium]|nr:hypothetical protein [Bacteroidales bacterium]